MTPGTSGRQTATGSSPAAAARTWALDWPEVRVRQVSQRPLAIHDGNWSAATRLLLPEAFAPMRTVSSKRGNQASW